MNDKPGFILDDLTKNLDAFFVCDRESGRLVKDYSGQLIAFKAADLMLRSEQRTKPWRLLEDMHFDEDEL